SASSRISDFCNMKNNHEHPGKKDDCCDHQHAHEEEKPSRSTLNEGVAAKATTVLAVSGMDCADEVKLLHETLRPIGGVRSVEANLMTAKVTVMHTRASRRRSSSRRSNQPAWKRSSQSVGKSLALEPAHNGGAQSRLVYQVC
ncbi:MAG: hypothetical protein M3Q46_06930, partial [Verrucomicrobiota bacterium]|nr:hypothetical protein [Verrucomicrobiota bacterium]